MDTSQICITVIAVVALAVLWRQVRAHFLYRRLRDEIAERLRDLWDEFDNP